MDIRTGFDVEWDAPRGFAKMEGIHRKDSSRMINRRRFEYIYVSSEVDWFEERADGAFYTQSPLSF